MISPIGQLEFVSRALDDGIFTKEEARILLIHTDKWNVFSDDDSFIKAIDNVLNNHGFQLDMETINNDTIPS